MWGKELLWNFHLFVDDRKWESKCEVHNQKSKRVKACTFLNNLIARLEQPFVLLCVGDLDFRLLRTCRRRGIPLPESEHLQNVWPITGTNLTNKGTDVAQKLIKTWKWNNPHWTVTAATVQPQKNLSNSKNSSCRGEEVEPKAETIIALSPFTADPVELREWEAAPTAKATCPLTSLCWGTLQKPAREICEGNLVGISYLPLLLGVSPKHGVLEQRSLQFVKEEKTAKCFILLNAKIEPDSGSTL